MTDYQESRLIWQRMLNCNSLGIFAHVSQNDLVNYTSIGVSILTGITLLPKVWEIIRGIFKRK